MGRLFFYIWLLIKHTENAEKRELFPKELTRKLKSNYLLMLLFKLNVLCALCVESCELKA